MRATRFLIRSVNKRGPYLTFLSSLLDSLSTQVHYRPLKWQRSRITTNREGRTHDRVPLIYSSSTNINTTMIHFYHQGSFAPLPRLYSFRRPVPFVQEVRRGALHTRPFHKRGLRSLPSERHGGVGTLRKTRLSLVSVVRTASLERHDLHAAGLMLARGRGLFI